MAVNVAVIKNNLMAVKSPQVAVVFARSGSKGLQGSGNTAKKCPAAAGWAGWLVGAAADALAAGACSEDDIVPRTYIRTTYLYDPLIRPLHGSCHNKHTTKLYGKHKLRAGNNKQSWDIKSCNSMLLMIKC